MKNPLTKEEVSKILRYDPDTGEFYNPETGAQVDHYPRNGYRCIRVRTKTWASCHRLAWLLTYGEWPVLHIDHINRDRADNRICNLRLATPSQNQYNRPAQRNNKCGVKGAYWRKNDKRWIVALTVDGVKRTVGLYKTLEEAKYASELFCKTHHGEFAMQ